MILRRSYSGRGNAAAIVLSIRALAMRRARFFWVIGGGRLLGEAGNAHSPGFSIGEVSQAVGLAPQTLRLWEREGLVRPRRTGRGPAGVTLGSRGSDTLSNFPSCEDLRTDLNVGRMLYAGGRDAVRGPTFELGDNLLGAQRPSAGGTVRASSRPNSHVVNDWRRTGCARTLSA